MTTIDAVVEKLKRLPLERQLEVLDFAEFLEHKGGRGRPRRSLEGALASLGVEISKDEIDEARREAWARFPRELPE
jgi:hypothetical protein